MDTSKQSWYEFPIFNLYIKPTYSVLIPQRGKREQKKSEAQLRAELNLKENKVKGELSNTSITKLKNAINWLTAAAPEKRVYHKETKKHYKFKLNFITLTLPTTEHSISDEYFKKKMLHNFLNTARYKFGLKNYVWKVEAQNNGNIHAHITTDTFIHYEALRKCWNKILDNNGLIAPYTQKHENMTFDEYNKIYNPDGKKAQSKVQQAFSSGCESKWKNPNSTDVKAVHKISDIAAYLVKYMAKSEEGKRKIKGRLWGCSYSLSQANNLTIEVNPENEKSILKPLMQPQINFKEITVNNKMSSIPKKIGELFMYAMKDWGTLIKGELLDIYHEHLFFIRNDINVQALKFMNYENLIQPEPIEIYDDLIIGPKPEECPF